MKIHQHVYAKFCQYVNGQCRKASALHIDWIFISYLNEHRIWIPGNNTSTCSWSLPPLSERLARHYLLFLHSFQEMGCQFCQRMPTKLCWIPVWNTSKISVQNTSKIGSEHSNTLFTRTEIRSSKFAQQWVCKQILIACGWPTSKYTTTQVYYGLFPICQFLTFAVSVSTTFLAVRSDLLPTRSLFTFPFA